MGIIRVRVLAPPQNVTMRIFISYAHDDEYLVRQLVDILIAGNHIPWFDHRLLAGRSWQDQLLEAIAACDVFLYALTPESLDSKWCWWEFGQAVQMGKPILPVLMQRVDLPDVLSRQQYVDFSKGPTPPAVARLLAGVPNAEPIPPETMPAMPDEPGGRPERPVEDTASLADVLYAEAEDFCKAKQYAEARESLLDCLALAPDHPGAKKLLTVVERRLARAKPPATDAPEAGRGDQGEPRGVAPAITLPSRLDLAEILGFPAPVLVIVPAGPFLIGSDPARDPVPKKLGWTGEFPQITVSLPEYLIGQYPVTVEEYRVFVERGSYRERRWWTDAGWRWREEEGVTQPDDWDNKKWTGDPRLPVVGVTWYEAWAYTQWLTAQVAGARPSGLSRPSPLPPGWVCRLPTEAEWEKAARGTDGRIYPWGDAFDKARCNTRESSIGRTTPVGQFSPAGDSPYGCADMAGNVWEWCLTKEDWNYADGLETMDNGPEGEAARVGRGGSWFIDLNGARAAYRSRPYPYDRFIDCGFRVVCGRPPSL